MNGLQLKYSVVLLKYIQIQIHCKTLVQFLFPLVNLFVYNECFQVEITRLRIYFKKMMINSKKSINKLKQQVFPHEFGLNYWYKI